MEKILQTALEAERCAVGVYNEILNYVQGRDHRTYDLALAILHEEVEHEAWFEELLTGSRAATSGEECRARALTSRGS